MKKWIVLCVHGARIASFPLNPHNLDLMRRLFRGSLIQRDASGTEHWAAMRAPTDREIKGLELDKTHPGSEV